MKTTLAAIAFPAAAESVLATIATGAAAGLDVARIDGGNLASGPRSPAPMTTRESSLLRQYLEISNCGKLTIVRPLAATSPSRSPMDRNLFSSIAVPQSMRCKL